MKKIDKLYKEFVSKQTVETLSTVDSGYFTPKEQDLFQDFFDTYKKYMNLFDIGTNISKKKWGDRRVKQIQSILKQTMDKQTKAPKKNSLQLFDELEKEVGGKQFTSYDFARVARTETAAMKAAFQLVKFKEAGIEKVRHKTRNDNRVSEICKRYNNRVFKIDDLLARDSDRIPVHVQCRCRYEPVVQ